MQTRTLIAKLKVIKLMRKLTEPSVTMVNEKLLSFCLSKLVFKPMDSVIECSRTLTSKECYQNKCFNFNHANLVIKYYTWTNFKDQGVINNDKKCYVMNHRTNVSKRWTNASCKIWELTRCNVPLAVDPQYWSKWRKWQRPWGTEKINVNYSVIFSICC